MTPITYLAPFQAFDPRSNSFKPYVELAVRTAAPLIERQNLLHAVLGIADELLEIGQLFQEGGFGEDNINLIKELGDLTWFTALYANWNPGTEGQEVFFMRLYEAADNRYLQAKEEAPEGLVIATVNKGVYVTVPKCVSLTKKEYAYAKPMSIEQADELFISALTVVATLCAEFNLDITNVLSRNIEKLDARYNKGSFTQEAAINRDESKE